MYFFPKLYQEDLIKVNGYNENMIGWGREDSEIACRLTFAGIQKRFIKNAAIAFHIFHPENSRSQDNINNQIMLQTFQEKRTWCDKGLNQYLTGKESE